VDASSRYEKGRGKGERVTYAAIKEGSNDRGVKGDGQGVRGLVCRLAIILIRCPALFCY
jgi:hypothetical protein